MNEDEPRQRMIIESWPDDDPLGAFARERPETPDPPDVVFGEEALAVEPGPSSTNYQPRTNYQPPTTNHQPRPTAAVIGVAGLAFVAATTVGVLIMFVGSGPSSEEVATTAGRVDSIDPVQVGSAGQIEREVVPESTIDLSPRAVKPPASRSVSPPPKPSRTPRAVADARTSKPTARPPAPTASKPPITPVRPAAANTTPSPNNAAPAAGGAIAPTPPRAEVAPPSSVVLAPPPSVITAAPSAIPPAVPTSGVTESPPSTIKPTPPSAAPAAATSVVTSAVPSAVTAQSAVTAVLQRYAKAFSALDARAAKAVWPQVNQNALARAFSDLEEQQFDLGSCNVSVTGGSAVASCAGRASYTPKVGNRTRRSESREWTFYLEQNDQAWSIASVKMR